MLRRLIPALVFALTLPLAAQEGPQPQPDSKVTIPKKKTAPPRSDQQQKDKQESDSSQNDEGFSTSKDYVIDLRPPAGRRAEEEEPSDVNELKPWDPHKAAKSIEVGDYYFKRKKYGAAESRYREALEYKPNDAMASFRLGQVLERTKRGSEAIEYYQAYLKILPEGEFSEECRKAIARLSGNAKN